MTIWAVIYLIMQGASLIWILARDGTPSFVLTSLMWLPTLFVLFMGGFFG